MRPYIAQKIIDQGVGDFAIFITDLVLIQNTYGRNILGIDRDIIKIGVYLKCSRLGLKFEPTPIKFSYGYGS